MGRGCEAQRCEKRDDEGSAPHDHEAVAVAMVVAVFGVFIGGVANVVRVRCVRLGDRNDGMLVHSHDVGVASGMVRHHRHPRDSERHGNREARNARQSRHTHGRYCATRACDVSFDAELAHSRRAPRDDAQHRRRDEGDRAGDREGQGEHLGDAGRQKRCRVVRAGGLHRAEA